MKHLLFFYILTALHIIPAPASVEMDKGSYRLSGSNFNCEASLDEKTQNAIAELADRISLVSEKTTSFAPSPNLSKSPTLKGVCFLKDASKESGEYSIDIRTNVVKVLASDFYGFLYAIQTLKQMLPPSIYGTVPAPSEKYSVPCCRIHDKPRFGYRGMHLDCARHFFSVNEVLRYLDIMAVYKLNTLHWHLSDDQGWRVEIRRFPMLTTIGAYRSGTQVGYDRASSDGISYGGYYTQDEIRVVVEYASRLGITIIPEIDLPGHMLAALASYPELGCTGGPYRVWTRWGISPQVLCPGKDETFAFLRGVMDEICELFPSEYIHIGGDECPKTEWEKCPLCQKRIEELGLVSDEHATKEQRLQNYVMATIQKYLEGKGRKIIGWDEILEGELSEGATVMSWRGTKGGIKAAAMGFDVIMTPNTYCYFDYAQSTDLKSEPLGNTRDPKRAIPLEKIYSYDPLLNLDEASASHIKGVQANLWTEYIQTPDHLEYMLLPRLLALSEVQWCDPGKKDWDRFCNSIRSHQYGVFEAMMMNYRKLD